MKATRFDLEQKILDCWHICDDLDDLLEGILEHDMTTDQISNVVLGMRELYQLKFSKTFGLFEACVEAKEI